MTVPKQSEVSR